MGFIPKHKDRRDIILTGGVGHANEVVPYKKYKEMATQMGGYCIFVVAGPGEWYEIIGSKGAVGLVDEGHLAIRIVEGEPDKKEAS